VIVLLSLVALAVSQHATRRAPQPIEPACLKCLCEVDSGCTNSNCTEDPDRFGGGPQCGWYKINKHYYRGCGGFGRQTKEPEDEAFERCASEKECAESCINLWLTFGLPCTPAEGEPEISLCESHARKHYGGPGGCWKPATNDYWQSVNECLKAK